MITSLQNPGVKEVISLKKKRKARREADAFLVEGPRMYQEAPADHLLRVYMSETFYEKNRPAPPEGVPFEVVSDPVFAAMSDTETPQGVICVVRQYHWELPALFGQKREPLCMILEDIQDPGNLGTILRTAEGAGVTGIIMSSGCADIYSPKVIRSTMGSIFRMPFVRTESLEAAIRFLRRSGLAVYAAHLEGSVPYDTENYTKACAFLIGNEGRGLKEETAALCERRIRIPMEGQVESLNAAVASALLMYEAARQRRR